MPHWQLKLPGLLRAFRAVLWRICTITAGQLTGWFPGSAQVPAFQVLPLARGLAFPQKAAMKGKDEVLLSFDFFNDSHPTLTHPVTPHNLNSIRDSCKTSR